MRATRAGSALVCAEAVAMARRKNTSLKPSQFTATATHSSALSAPSNPKKQSPSIPLDTKNPTIPHRHHAPSRPTLSPPPRLPPRLCVSALRCSRQTLSAPMNPSAALTSPPHRKRHPLRIQHHRHLIPLRQHRRRNHHTRPKLLRRRYRRTHILPRHKQLHERRRLRRRRPDPALNPLRRSRIDPPMPHRI